jgi:hypothetical protein
MYKFQWKAKSLIDIGKNWNTSQVSNDLAMLRSFKPDAPTEDRSFTWRIIKVQAFLTVIEQEDPKSIFPFPKSRKCPYLKGG